MSDAAALYSAIAPDYDRSYAVSGHRRVYDQLAWEAVLALPRPPGAHVIDVGCGTGRWAARLLDLGCRVTGIENAPGMILQLEARALGADFTLVRGPMEEVVLPPAGADLVLAMGSVQFARDPDAMLRRFAGWLRPGGWLCVYVDSLVSLVLELMRRGDTDEALERLQTRRGVFRQHGEAGTLRLYDRQSLEGAFAAAGLSEISCRGLAIGAAATGRNRGGEAGAVDHDTVMAAERGLSAEPLLADCGLHLLGIGRRRGEKA